MLKSLCLINFQLLQGKFVLIFKLIHGTARTSRHQNKNDSMNHAVAFKEIHKFDWYIIFIVLINTILIVL